VEKLRKYLKQKSISEEEALERIMLQDLSPSTDFYRTIVSASEQINELIRNKTLDLDDPYQKSLLRLLESGDKVSKTIKNAQMDAYPNQGDDNESIGDMLGKKKA
jgi:hypothetical protein